MVTTTVIKQNNSWIENDPARVQKACRKPFSDRERTIQVGTYLTYVKQLNAQTFVSAWKMEKCPIPIIAYLYLWRVNMKILTKIFTIRSINSLSEFHIENIPQNCLLRSLHTHTVPYIRVCKKSQLFCFAREWNSDRLGLYLPWRSYCNNDRNRIKVLRTNDMTINKVFTHVYFINYKNCSWFT